MPFNEELKELVRLTKENNRMLHSMRRHAFWGGLIKFILYALILVAAPLWLYSTYLAPVMEQILETYQQVQGTGAKAQAQFTDLQDVLTQFKNQFSPQE
ncbi:hypothetical protein A2853_00640 [Candidatus Kaiserbacteria bacterium RIFCSPHIGHO2_01_FULL_55_17]|uniref:Uncharacterized protein n=1 Tax=Candidatus Kaiserbacteria bacterium RIFCSPHIGHO2_01_FULL_55_17 TaxID=1798484 RepID=A0A1F6D7N2_9BACT|nr:MAG: hypothetical protein A2853_00640 [Candidatus Kaiserbacteria bacterium RIFCSPHIGHO2_01_FULL_55_17]